MELLRAGRSFLFRTDQDTKPHLWFVLTEPAGSPAQIVAVMLRTAKAYTDETLVLQPGDHPFVRHASSVHYSTAQSLLGWKIERAIKTGQCHLCEDMSQDLLRRVRQGLLESPFTVNAIKDYCRTLF